MDSRWILIFSLVLWTLHGTASGYSLMDYCTLNADCDDANTECREEGANTGMLRCQCLDGYVLVASEDDGVYYCAGMTHEGVHSECETCEDNDGMCYLDGNADVKCRCTASKSGDNCEFTNVEVTCDVVEFEMVICYTPHDTMDFDDSAMLNTDGYMLDPACRGFLVTGDDICADNTYKIILPLNDDDRARCGTSSIEQDIYTRKYETLVVAHNDPNQLSVDDILFKTYCSFETYAARSFQALGVMSINKNDRGEHKTPTLTMGIETLMGSSIPPGIPLRLGDKIKLRIALQTDGTYAALRVLRCTASTKPTMPDPKAVTVPLVLGSCPYPRQQILTLANFFQAVSQSEVVTGQMRMFKLSQGNTVHLHCVVKLCLSGSESECAGEICETGGGQVGVGRRRRRNANQAETMEVALHRELIVQTDESESQGGGSDGGPFMLLGLGIVALLLLSLVMVSVLLYRRLANRMRNKQSMRNNTSGSLEDSIDQISVITAKSRESLAEHTSPDSGVASRPTSYLSSPNSKENQSFEISEN